MQPVSPQLPALTATIAGGAAATVKPAETAKVPGLAQSGESGLGPKINLVAADSQVSNCYIRSCCSNAATSSVLSQIWWLLESVSRASCKHVAALHSSDAC